MVLPGNLLKKYEKDFKFYSNTVSCFEQHTLAKFMAKGYYERYINRMRLIYKERLDIITDFISRGSLKNIVKIKGENVGLHILLELINADENEFIEKTRKAGIYFAPCSDYYHGKSYNPPAVILGYSGISTENIIDALTELEKLFK